MDRHLQQIVALSATFFLTALGGCTTLPSYPDRDSVRNQATKLPESTSIKDGRAYLSSVRENLTKSRGDLQTLQNGLNAGIVGGVVTFAMGTALNWSAHTNTRAGILTGTLIGVDSNLSLKTQQLIINKGLDALMCVEAQAEDAYAGVHPYDSRLELVRQDVQEIEDLISSPRYAELANTNEQLAVEVADARSNARLAKTWADGQSGPVANVVRGADSAVNYVLQTTVDQLGSILPDGSAFAKIDTSYTKRISNVTEAPAMEQMSNPPSPQAVSNAKSELQRLRTDVSKGNAAVAQVQPHHITLFRDQIARFEKRLADNLRKADRKSVV